MQCELGANNGDGGELNAAVAAVGGGWSEGGSQEGNGSTRSHGQALGLEVAR